MKKKWKIPVIVYLEVSKTHAKRANAIEIGSKCPNGHDNGRTPCS